MANENPKEEIQSHKLKDQFLKMIEVNTPIIFIQSYDFVRVDEFILDSLGLSDLIGTERGITKIENKIKTWNPVTKNVPFVREDKDEQNTKSLLDFLTDEYTKKGDVDIETGETEPLKEKYLVLKEVQSFIDKGENRTSSEADAVCAVLLLMAQRRLYDSTFNTTVIIVNSTPISFPDGLLKYVSTIEFDYPLKSAQEIENHINNYAEIYGCELTQNDKDALIPQLKGMTAFEIDRVLDMAMSVGGTLSAKDKDMIFNQKKAMVKQAGVLQLIDDSDIDLDSIGGMKALKEYLTRKSKVINNSKDAESFGVGIPKGVFIVGMPGCGKSLCAKASSKLFGAPLLKLDMGSMMGKYLGESEANLRKAIQIAEAAAPCVLWIDEIEKAFAGVGNDGGGGDSLIRMFGYFLGWMQDKKSRVYVVGTANNAEKLPPELKRKGRFDEIFCVNLPCKEERESIFKVHLNKLKDKECLKGLNIDSLAKELSADDITKGFNGADIEAMINDAVEEAFCNDNRSPLTSAKLKDTAKKTISISKSCGTQLKQMEEIFKQNSFKDSNTGEITKK